MVEILGFTITPFLPDTLVEIFGKSLSKAVSKGFGQDGTVVVVIVLEFLTEVLDTETSADSERADVVRQAGFLRGNEVGEGKVELTGAFVHLLAQEMECGKEGFPRRVGVEFNVVAVGVGGK